MNPNLVSKNIINSINVNNIKLKPIENVSNSIFFDNDFFITLAIIIILSLYLSYVLYTKRANKYNKYSKKNYKLFNNIRNYCSYVKKTEYLKNLNQYL